MLIGLLAALLAAAALLLTHHGPHPALAPRPAVQTARRLPVVRSALAGVHGVRAAVAPIDSRLTRVTFSSGGRVLAAASLTGSGQVVLATDYVHQRVPYGDWIAYQPALLIGLAALFVAAAAVTPWRRWRNLDVLALLVLTAAVLLFARRYVSLSLVASAPALAYLMARCLLHGLGRAGTDVPSHPLFSALTPWLDGHGRNRLLRLLLAALAVIVVLVGVSSPMAVDVSYAVMEGATRLLHGVLPYGHLPGDVIHGDTYPLLSYLLYVPLAWITPVASVWDSVDLALGAAVAAALLVAWLVRRLASTEEAGLRSALAWLAFPPVLITASTGTTDLALAAMLLGALLLWRRSGTSTAVLTAAGWFKLAPFALLGLWLVPREPGERRRGVLAAVAVSLPLIALLVILGGVDGPGAMIRAVGYQLSRGTPQSVWAALGIDWLQPVAEAAALGLIVGVAVALRSRRGPALDPGRIAALAAAQLLALQLAANYWAFLYLCWIVPLWCVSLLGAVPATVAATTSPAALPDLDPIPVAG